MQATTSIIEGSSLRDRASNLLYRFKSSARADLLESVEFSLLLFENHLINTASGEYREVRPHEDDESFAEPIARAAGELVDTSDAQHAPSILLLMPPHDFVATSYQMAMNNERMIRSALQLQAHSLVPAYDGDLLLGVDASSPHGVALWYPARHADRLYRALSRAGLFLAAIMPRTLAAAGQADKDGSLLIHDDDGETLTRLQLDHGTIKGLQTVSRRDLRQEPFAQQWDEAEEALDADGTRRMARLEDWTALRGTVEVRPDYCFLPAGAAQVSRQLEKERRRKLAGGLALAALVVICLPFLNNWVQINRLESRMQALQEQTVDVRDHQATVYSLQEEWGALAEYPDQDVAGALLSLNEVIEYSLTSFAINRSVIDIQGYAEDPAYLVELLAQQEMFYNVTQSRSVTGGGSAGRGDRFGIRMRLRGADFEEYNEKYPVRAQD